ncbi:3-isopropylmalate dehydratase small subunit [Kitasatospora sp. GAS204B]|uniref:3-isopropylmalate dehydratase small subunit n=1 Tax=unclassified Kitasatospora TaxID=2633591 RepID=UPI002473F56E|nr:3-isopropylmalate dehydratase small subunit [Kitasatospora sp. GAS204B]MDH6117258.1 3-isopropylmalate/(R)-2-methylmalate dehydratase small subunit [Kitasatospora sp. GAS204B]
MEAFRIHTGRVLPMRRSNIDTDQLIPVRFLKRLTRTGYADGLFAAWREEPGFELDRPEYQGATVLVAGPEFGTGSSREHAVWSLLDHGFRVVISSRFADIFRGNSLKNGLLTIQLDQEVVEALWERAEQAPDQPVTVDLEALQVRAADLTVDFELDPYHRMRLLEGLDEIDATLRYEDAVRAFEATRPSWLPTVEVA